MDKAKTVKELQEMYKLVRANCDIVAFNIAGALYDRLGDNKNYDEEKLSIISNIVSDIYYDYPYSIEDIVDEAFNFIKERKISIKTFQKYLEKEKNFDRFMERLAFKYV